MPHAAIEEPENGGGPPRNIGPDEWVDADSWAQTTWITLCSIAGICLLHSEVLWCIKLLVVANLAHHLHLWHLRLRCRKQNQT